MKKLGRVCALGQLWAGAAEQFPTQLALGRSLMVRLITSLRYNAKRKSVQLATAPSYMRVAVEVCYSLLAVFLNAKHTSRFPNREHECGTKGSLLLSRFLARD